MVASSTLLKVSNSTHGGTTNMRWIATVSAFAATAFTTATIVSPGCCGCGRVTSVAEVVESRKTLRS